MKKTSISFVCPACDERRTLTFRGRTLAEVQAKVPIAGSKILCPTCKTVVMTMSFPESS